MKNSIFIIILLALSFSSQAKFYSGEQLYQYGESYKKISHNNSKPADDMLLTGIYLGYIASVLDVYGSEGAEVFCQPNGQLGTYADLVYKFLDENPEKRVKSAEENIIEVMQKSFKCSTPPKWMNGK